VRPEYVKEERATDNKHGINACIVSKGLLLAQLCSETDEKKHENNQPNDPV